jgi:hypothetical protein
MIFGACKVQEFQILKSILDLFCSATGMQINMKKSNMLTCALEDELLVQSDAWLPFKRENIDIEIKYLGFKLKPWNYRLENWLWFPRKIQARVSTWAFYFLSKGGHMVLINSVLDSIHVYWASIAKIPKGIFTKIRKICFQFLWSGKKDATGIPLVKWTHIAMPKLLGGWGVKYILWFSKALTSKSLWRLIHNSMLWSRVMASKYSPRRSVVECFPKPNKPKVTYSIVWKAMVEDFTLIEDWIA